ncbi:poly A polymerase head domain protein [Clostridium baratii str. Sullivan]|uniref:Poly A polymerase head domain protein n=1 Tax=Clostridium baratii str. Sullivan TaxID=1415775 RepID=A0A0A7FSH5_9CLOT|nr:CCA tRNA nucleotidyltransferase [Clostridium baratii]AIY82523.1 poly A polymerase head domain protein [Clostridium baratii str. Sullivan]MDU1054545.1 CCA tRNA nucleotidyltransferase [Clostridium baratii]
MNITIPSNVKYIIDEFYKNNYEAFMVGGCIRDALLCKVPKDYDIATSAKPEITEKLFKKTIPTGIKHGTVTVLIDNEPYEVTTYRTEGKYKDNRRPDEVYFVSDIKEDLSRRDFTINAFAYNSREGLKDFFGGLDDLNNSLIRSVGDANKRFNEDALRMLRAIRFSTQLNFDIEENTLNAIKNNKDLIKNISSERIRDELCKILVSKNVRKGLNLLEKCGLLQIIIPEIVPSIGFDQKNMHHFEDVFNHTISVIEKCPEDLTIRLAALLHDIGKPDVFFIDDNGNGRFFGHNTRSEKIARDVLNRLRFDNKTIKAVCILVREHMNVLDNASNLAIKRLINRVSKENIYSLLALQKADILSLNDPNVALYKVSDMKNKIDNIIDSNTPLTVKDLAIDGGILIKELNLKPGKIIGETLDYLLQLVLKDSSLNTTAILLEESKTFIKNKKG